MRLVFRYIHGPLAGETKRRVFQIPCETQRGLDLLHRITRKRETSENEGIVLGFGTAVRQKENGVRAHNGGFLQTSAPG